MDIRHILVPVDFGAASAEALELACELAAKLEAKLTLLHSFYVPPAAYGYDTMLWTADWLTDSRKDLDSLTADTRRRHADTEGVWLEGDPRIRILEVAQQRSVNLIVAGTHGRRGLSRLFFGSVASRLMRSSPVPLITTGAGPERKSLRPRFRHIVVATDFGEPAQQAQTLACDLASRFDAHITLVHAMPSFTSQLARTMPEAALPTELAKRALDAAVDRAKEKVFKVDSVLVEGDPREQIARIAADCRADLIAMGTHARPGLPRHLLGSVAETVVRASAMPVLTATCEAGSS